MRAPPLSAVGRVTAVASVGHGMAKNDRASNAYVKCLFDESLMFLKRNFAEQTCAPPFSLELDSRRLSTHSPDWGMADLHIAAVRRDQQLTR
jgi:hypothetical protein